MDIMISFTEYRPRLRQTYCLLLFITSLVLSFKIVLSKTIIHLSQKPTYMLRPVSLLLYFGGLAQLVEHLICIQRVRSSSLLASIRAVIAQWLERDTDNVEVPSSSLGGRTLNQFILVLSLSKARYLENLNYRH